MTRKLVAMLCAVVLLGAMLAPTTLAEEEKVLNIFTWETYFDQDTVLAPFTAETGIRINYTNFSLNEEMIAKLEASGGGDYDIVLASDYALDIVRNAGLLAELDKSKIPNYENLDPNFLGQYFDPDGLYTIPYAAGTPLIVYDPALVDIEVTGYESLWDPALADSIVMMDDMRNVVGVTLKTMGQSFNITDADVLAQAREKLLKLKPNIRALDYDSPHNLMISGEATVGYMFTPQVAWTLSERPDLKLVYPEEGMGGFGIDAVVIPVNAPHKDNAHAFLDFILRPEIGAKIAEVQQYINCNQAAIPLLPESYLNNPVVFIPQELLGETEFIQDVGDAVSIYNEMWTAFKQQ